jgi:pimeloyl-ACP methyl ester carboxylesterase
MVQATARGVSLHFVRDGDGDPPIVFVHGWCCDHDFFQPQFDHFKARHRVVAVDLRGCGESDRPDGGYDVPTLTDDVAALCSDLGLERSVIVGHSLGGMIAIDMAARHPSLVGAVIAVDPGPIDMLPGTRALFEAFVAALEGPDSDAARRSYIDGMFLPGDATERRRWITDTMCSAPLPVALGVLRGVLTWNGVGAFKLCSAPALVLLCETGGSNDPSRLLAIKSDTTIGVTVGAGHFHQLEVPDQVNAMIARFLDTLA